KRAALTTALYQEFNKTVFGAQLPPDMSVTWSKRLTKTAGRCFQEKRLVGGATVYSARVELSVKVVDDLAKLRNTLMHELCHAAQWLLNHTSRPPHGPEFRHWGRRAEEAYPDIVCQTCHSYDIAYRFHWRCVRCGVRYGRHSRSINTETQACGGCGGRL
ncbi:SprT-like family-domain-containing protein, partial [Fimicolochytrium jonesii]|uniref:SprT-like family-domain-containing protein n=1 Tax=Fimicolochytrium jonesii TaxID=1396493 RepID=UPI0022FE2738